MPIFKLWIVSYIVDVYFPDAVLADVFPLLLLLFWTFCFVVFSPRTACTHSRKGCCKYLVEWWWLKSSVWNWNRYKLSFLANRITTLLHSETCHVERVYMALWEKRTIVFPFNAMFLNTSLNCHSLLYSSI